MLKKTLAFIATATMLAGTASAANISVSGNSGYTTEISDIRVAGQKVIRDNHFVNGVRVNYDNFDAQAQYSQFSLNGGPCHNTRLTVGYTYPVTDLIYLRGDAGANFLSTKGTDRGFTGSVVAGAKVPVTKNMKVGLEGGFVHNSNIPTVFGPVDLAEQIITVATVSYSF